MMKSKRFKLKAYLFGVILISMLGIATAVIPEGLVVKPKKPIVKAVGPFTNIDDSVLLQDDFFSYINGMVHRNINKDGKPANAICYISDQVDVNAMNMILNNCHFDTINIVARSLYKTKMPVIRQILQEKLREVDGIANKTEFLKEAANLAKSDISLLGNMHLGLSQNNSKTLVIEPIDNSSLWELKDDEERIQMIRDTFLAGTGIGVDLDTAKQILEVEKAMHELPAGNIVDKDLQPLMNSGLGPFFNNLQITGIVTLVKSPQNYLKNLITMVINKFDVPTLKAYLKFEYLVHYEPLWSRDLSMAQSSNLEQKEEKIKEEKVENEENPAISLNLQYYTYQMLKDMFSDSALNTLCFGETQNKSFPRIVKIFNSIKDEYIARINTTSWIQQKGELIGKLNSLDMQIGNGSKIMAYQGLALNENDPVYNMELIAKARYQDAIKNFAGLQDLSVAENNNQASYDKVNNKIIIPISNMNLPYFDIYTDDIAINYGNVGVNIAQAMAAMMVDSLNGMGYSARIGYKVSMLAAQNTEFANTMEKKYAAKYKAIQQELKVGLPELLIGKLRNRGTTPEGKANLTKWIGKANVPAEIKGILTVLLLGAGKPNYNEQQSIAISNGIHGVIANADGQKWFGVKGVVLAEMSMLRAEADDYKDLEVLYKNIADEYKKNTGSSKSHIVYSDFYYNIGLAAAYNAYKSVALTLIDELPVINNFSPDQRFYASFAASHRQNMCQLGTQTTDEMIVNASLIHQPRFYGAFHNLIKPKDMMYLPPNARLNFWAD